MFIDPSGFEYGKLREFVYSYASAFGNDVEFTYDDKFVIVTIGDFERAFYRSLANGEIMSEGAYLAERIEFKKPGSIISYVTYTLYGKDKNADYYQYHTGVKIKYF